MKLGKLIIINLGFVLLFLIIAEGFFRVLGYEAGLICDRPPFDPMPEQLFEYKDYSADENGIMRFSNAAVEEVARLIADSQAVYADEFLVTNQIVADFRDLKSGKFEGEFAERYAQLAQKAPADLNAHEQRMLNYVEQPINRSGFRSVPFEKADAQTLSVLLLGDSHTFGAEASNLLNSFADRLLARGYLVYNTGIVATDPAQYLAVAQKYVPELKPDVVVVNFCLNNDIAYFKRQPKPGQKVYYATNADNIMACPDGIYLKSPQEAFEFVKNECYINPEISFFSALCARSVLLTRLWLIARECDWVETMSDDQKRYFEKVAEFRSEKPVSEDLILQIKEVSESHGAQFILSAIPDGDDLEKRPEDVPGLFKQLQPVLPESTTSADRAAGGHFNDEGYRKYTDHIERIIRNASERPSADPQTD